MHEIQILVGSEMTLRPVARALGSPMARYLYDGLSVLPILESSVADVAGLEAFDWPDLEQQPEQRSLIGELSPFMAILRESKPPGSSALILTQYWGGWGTQAALQFLDGKVVWGPAVG